MKKRVWPILLASALGLAILLSLGFWQIQRLAWKQQLFAELDKSLAADPITLAESKGWAFKKIKAKGVFVQKPAIRMLSSHQSGPAWQLVQGFVTDQREALLVITGKQPHGAAEATVTSKEIEILGFTQSAPRPGIFDVANDIKNNQWTWWDVPALEQQFGLKNTSLILLVPNSPGTEGLHVDPPKANLRNNHLGYAITWFGLAIALIVMTALFVRARMKEG